MGLTNNGLLLVISALSSLQWYSLGYAFSERSAGVAPFDLQTVSFDKTDDNFCSRTISNSALSRVQQDLTIFDDSAVDKDDEPQNNISLDYYYYLPPEWEALSVENRTKLSKILRWENLKRWDFDIWELNELSGGNPLLFLGWTLLASPYAEYAMARSVGGGDRQPLLSTISGYHFVDKFHIQVDKLCAFIKSIEVGYQKDVIYHNGVHAADVFQTLHALLQMMMDDNKSFVQLDDIEIFSVLLAAAGHDVHHPGRNNQFQVNAKTEYASLYNNKSCLEQMHASSMIDRVSGAKWRPETDIVSGLLPEQLLVVQNLLQSTILHTDMQYHFKMLNDMDSILLMDVATELSANDNERLLAFLLHAADISNAAKPAPLFVDWANLVLEEFFQQGDEEKALNLPVSPLCDRQATSRAGSQIGFIENIIVPTFQRLGEFSERVKAEVLPTVLDNLEYWRLENGLHG